MTTELEIRACGPADAPELATVQRRAILHIAPRFYSREERESWARGAVTKIGEWSSHGGEVIRAVCCGKGQILGFAGWKPEGVTGVITRVFVKPDFQGCGIGRALVEQAETDFRGRELRRFSVTASLSGVAFFERLGYQTVARLLHETQGGVKIGMWDMEKLP